MHACQDPQCGALSCSGTPILSLSALQVSCISLISLFLLRGLQVKAASAACSERLLVPDALRKIFLALPPCIPF